MARIFDSVIANIDAGKMGLNQGLDIGLVRTIDYVPNLQRAQNYLIGGEPGTGKSSFAYNNFLYNPYDDWLQNYKTRINFHAFVFSMEMDKEIVLTKAICRKVFMDTNMLVDINFVLSRGRNRISQEIYDKVLATREYFEDFEDRVTILGNDNPTGIRKTIHAYFMLEGKDTFKEIEITAKDGSKQTIKTYDKYVPNDPDTIMYTLGIFDHVGLTKGERNFVKKQTIDKLVEYGIEDRDRYGMTNIYVQQLNRSNSSTDRFKLDKVEPQLGDFKETSDVVDAANFVMALFCPNRHEFKKHRDYNIDVNDGGLGDRYKYLKILKNRDGNANMGVGLAFLGEIGRFVELPRAREMTANHYKMVTERVKIVNNIALNKNEH